MDLIRTVAVGSHPLPAPLSGVSVTERAQRGSGRFFSGGTVKTAERINRNRVTSI